MSQFSRIILGGHSVRYPYGKQPRSRAKLIAFVAFIIALAAILAWDAYGAGLDDCYRATCRVEMGNSSGSGCVFKADAERYYVLTNAHVAGTTRGRQARVVFNRDGYEGTIPAMVEWGVYGDGKTDYTDESGRPVDNSPDAAIISVLKSNLDGYAPPVIPIASGDAPAGSTLLSVGAPCGGWLNSWTGHITENHGDAISFLPAPLPGRSGSALFNASGTSIVGLVTWQTNKGGGAQSVAAIRRAMGEPPTISPPDGTRPLVPVHPTQCPDGNCRPPILGGGGPWQNLPRNRPPATPPAVEPYKPTSPAAPAQPSSKGCECKPHEPCQCDQAAVAKIGDELNGLKSQITGLVDAVAKLNETPANPPLVPPVVQPDVPPQIKPAEVHHHVVVADLSAPGWPRVASEVEQARDVFPAIHVVDAKDVPFVVRPLPQLVTYDSKGSAIAIAKGERETSLALQRIYRRE